MKRYAVTIDMYVYAKDDNDISKESEKLIDLLKIEADSPEILTIHEVPYRHIGEAREVTK